MRIGVLGAGGLLGARVPAALAARGATAVPLGREVQDEDVEGLDAVAVAAPWGGAPRLDAPTVGVAATPEQVAGAGLVPDVVSARVPHAGWVGGLDALVAARAADAVGTPVAVHVAHALLPDLRRAWGRLPASLRGELVTHALSGGGRQRTDGDLEPVVPGEGRRLAWFPRPVGPWHAAAVPGSAHVALPDVPTVATWVAVGSLWAELVQALGRSSPDGWAARRVTGPGGGDTAGLRWAVVAEARSADGTVERCWVNGVDPLAAAAALLADAAVVAADHEGPAATLLDMAPARAWLDGLADARVLRWGVARSVSTG